MVAFDLETFGLNVFETPILEIGAVDASGRTFQRLVDNKRPIPRRIMELTSIYPDEVELNGVPLKQALVEFMAFIGTDPVLLVAHNIDFDLNVLWNNAIREDVHIPPVHTLDSMRAFQLCHPRSERSRLSDMCSVVLGQVTPTRHRALADARDALECVTRMAKDGDVPALHRALATRLCPR